MVGNHYITLHFILCFVIYLCRNRSVFASFVTNEGFQAALNTEEFKLLGVNSIPGWRNAQDGNGNVYSRRRSDEKGAAKAAKFSAAKLLASATAYAQAVAAAADVSASGAAAASSAAAGTLNIDGNAQELATIDFEGHCAPDIGMLLHYIT